jgi:hypothetical protein
MRAVTPPVAPQSPVAGGGAPYFSAKLGAWVRPPRDVRTTRPRSGSKRRNYGNVTLSQRGKIWIAAILYCAAVFTAGAWVWIDLYKGSGQ